jgi:hypothetical protein
MANSSLKLKSIAMASVVGVPPSSIQDIFAKQPLLVNLSAKTLVAKTRALKDLLGYSDLQLWQVVFTKPGVLLFATDKMRAKWDSLQQLAGARLMLLCGAGVWITVPVCTCRASSVCIQSSNRKTKKNAALEKAH